jgi:hypothetical protein
MIKKSFILSSSFSKTEEIFDFLIIPNQLINTLINNRLDLFNEIFNVIKSAKFELPENDLIKSIYDISYRIKLIFLKAILKSVLISSYEKPEDFFYYNYIYNFTDMYNFFQNEEIFENFLIEKIGDNSLNLFLESNSNYDSDNDNDGNNIENNYTLLIDNYKFSAFALFLFDLIFKNFEKKNEKMLNNIEVFFLSNSKFQGVNKNNTNNNKKGEDKEKDKSNNNNNINYNNNNEDNLIIKDAYSLNFFIDKSNNRMLELFKFVFEKIIELLINNNNTIKDNININDNDNDNNINSNFKETPNFSIKIFHINFIKKILNNFLVKNLLNFTQNYYFDNIEEKLETEFIKFKKNFFNEKLIKKEKEKEKEIQKEKEIDLLDNINNNTDNRKDFIFHFIKKKLNIFNFLKNLQNFFSFSQEKNSFYLFYSNIEGFINKIFMKIITKYFDLMKINLENFLKSNKEIKKIITPSNEKSNKDECDFVILLEINLKTILNFMGYFDFKETLEKNKLLKIYGNKIEEILELIKEYFYGNLFTIILPSNDIKEDLLSNFKKHIIDKIMNFNEQVYDYLNIKELWVNIRSIEMVIYFLYLY